MSEDLGHILETMAFKANTPPQIADIIVAKLMKGRDPTKWRYYSPIDNNKIAPAVADLVRRYGTLGVTQRKMIGMVTKRIKRIERRAAKARRKAYYEMLNGNQNA